MGLNTRVLEAVIAIWALSNKPAGGFWKTPEFDLLKKILH